MPNNEPTIASILRTLANQYDGPVAERQVLDRVLEQRPSSAKNPYATIRERLRWDGPALGWIRLDRNELMPIRVILQGLRFRCIPLNWEFESGLLPLVRLQPFAGLRNPAPLLQDTTGTPLFTTSSLSSVLNRRLEMQASVPSYDLHTWYAYNQFNPGDSILVTTINTEPLTFQIAREAATDFCTFDTSTQDREFLEAIFERVYHSHLPIIACDELILPILARASWRTTYPGHPWQTLVTQDLRLQLVDDIFVARKQNSSINFNGVNSMQHCDAEETALLSEIDTLQNELQRSRQRDEESGLWSGQIQRTSAQYKLSDPYFQGEFKPHPNLPDEMDSYTEDVSLSEGDEWDDLIVWEADELFGINANDEFDDVREQEIMLQEASQRLLAALPPDEAARLQDATPEEAEVIIAAHLNYLLVHEPSLFIKMDLTTPASSFLPDSQVQLGGSTFEVLWRDTMDDWDSDTDWDDTDQLERIEEHSTSAYLRSSELISQFYDYLIATGKSVSTARTRSRNLGVYAEFLAHYYNRTLAEGDYATMDECLFFFYPRKIMTSSARQAREICISLKQFYRFLVEHGVISDDRFAQALWQRRNQAARVIELYNQISHTLPNYDKLITLLFAPYSQ